MAHIIHCFYFFFFGPTVDIKYNINVHIDATTHINFNTYGKYLNDKWSVKQINKELRIKKLIRITK